MCATFKAVGLAKLFSVVIAILHNGKVPATILPVFLFYMFAVIDPRSYTGMLVAVLFLCVIDALVPLIVCLLYCVFFVPLAYRPM